MERKKESMKKQLEDLLSEYLGELMYESENEYDWVIKDRITRKINAINVLLSIPRETKTTMQQVIESMKKEKL